MDVPADLSTDEVPEAVPVATLRKPRSAQRRRSPADPAPADVEPVAAAVEAAFEPMAETVIETVTSPMVLPEPAPPIDAPSLTPPAPVEADIHAEDHVMDYANTADTVADNTNEAADQMVDRGQAVFADMNGRAKDAMEKGSKMVEELGAFGKGNLEAVVESSKIAAKGLETLGQDAAEFSRRSFESATAAMKTLAATRSPTEFMKLQSDYARSMFDTLIAETSRSTEKMLKLANDVAQPLSNRVAVAADKIKVVA